MTYPAALLFDLDGTLLDTAPDFIAVVNQLLEEENQQPLPADAIRTQVSNGAGGLIQFAFSLQPQDENFQRLRQRLLALYEQHLSRYSQLFADMEALLTTVEKKNIPWGIVTNKPSRYAVPLLKDLNLDQRCAVLICPDHVQNTKPHPEPLYLACSQLKVLPEQCVYVGDHQRDIEAGKNAGMKTVVALYGYIPAEENVRAWNADFYAQTPKDILDWLF